MSKRSWQVLSLQHDERQVPPRCLDFYKLRIDGRAQARRSHRPAPPTKFIGRETLPRVYQFSFSHFASPRSRTTAAAHARSSRRRKQITYIHAHHAIIC